MPKDIMARTSISGIVNGHVMEGNVLAVFNPDRGGHSSCEFPQLPPNFTPATFGNQV
jgi:hypothetical protein